ncbi:hypothetical protein BBO99_00009056 [Phytophthora kernoviae]|uniref:Uncharacterized protein n=1 Tax=Phytophthora kernoviae TaxID=325452 RepID=A0A3R7J2P9_9STRA|nr:hypothetical protein JM16_005567 [Phytophthora kernoviae]RLN74175.1 hypothetical protein BBO99_00009056 [Phytophthora kernoviae]
MAFVGRQVYRIMYPQFSDISSGEVNTLDPLWGEGQPLDNLQYVQHPLDQRWRYLPGLYVDDLSQTQDQLVPLNATLDDGSGGEAVLPLRLAWSPLSFARWQMQLTFAMVFNSQEQMGVPSSDLDALRSMVTDTHPILLAVTMTVSLLHLLFDWLAFRHDVSYWREKGDNVVGVSLRAMAAELGSQAVVLLYLVDQKSTLLVTAPQFISVLLLVWKVTKVWSAQRRQLAASPSAADNAASDKIDTMDKHSLRLLEETQRADSLATSHMLFLLAPLAAGYAVYSLLYVPHAGCSVGVDYSGNSDWGSVSGSGSGWQDAGWDYDSGWDAKGELWHFRPMWNWDSPYPPEGTTYRENWGTPPSRDLGSRRSFYFETDNGISLMGATADPGRAGCNGRDWCIHLTFHSSYGVLSDFDAFVLDHYDSKNRVDGIGFWDARERGLGSGSVLAPLVLGGFSPEERAVLQNISDWGVENMAKQFNDSRTTTWTLYPDSDELDVVLSFKQLFTLLPGYPDGNAAMSLLNNDPFADWDLNDQVLLRVAAKRQGSGVTSALLPRVLNFTGSQLFEVEYFSSLEYPDSHDENLTTAPNAMTLDLVFNRRRYGSGIPKYNLAVDVRFYDNSDWIEYIKFVNQWIVDHFKSGGSASEAPAAWSSYVKSSGSSSSFQFPSAGDLSASGFFPDAGPNSASGESSSPDAGSDYNSEAWAPEPHPVPDLVFTVEILFRNVSIVPKIVDVFVIADGTAGSAPASMWESSDSDLRFQLAPLNLSTFQLQRQRMDHLFRV